MSTKIDVLANGKADEGGNENVYQMIKREVLQHGKTHMLTLLTNVFRECDSELMKVNLGSVEFILHVKSQEGLEKLWNMYTTGELANRLTEILITDELTTEDKSNMAIKVTMHESDYRDGCRFFKESQKGPADQQELPVNMSDWTEEHVKRWLLGIGVKGSVADKLCEGGVDGNILKIYDKQNLIEDFDLKPGVIRLIIYCRDKLLDSIPSSNGVASTAATHDICKQVPDAGEESAIRNTGETSQPVVRAKTSKSRPKEESVRKKKTAKTEPTIQYQMSVALADEEERRTRYEEERRNQEITETDIIVPREDRITPSRYTLSTKEGDSESDFDARLPTYSPQSKESLPFGKAVTTHISPGTPTNEAPSFTKSEESPKIPTAAESHPSSQLSQQPAIPTSLQTEHETPSDLTESIGQLSQNAQNYEAILRMLLTGDGSGELDQSYYPILVANKAPSLPSECSKIGNIRQQFGFIKSIKWTTVLDFDSQSLSHGLCKIYHDDRMVTLQEPNLFKNVESEEELRNSIGFPEKTLWLFANGREDNPTIESPPMDLREWNKERSRDVEASISFFSKPSVIPKGRAAIVFLLLSDQDLGIVCDIFRKMSSSFQGLQNITCIAEDLGVYSRFVEIMERWFNKVEIDARSVVGLEWQDINRIMMRMSGVSKVEAYELPSRMPEKCFLSEKQKNEWNDITVLCKNECKNTDMNESNPGFKQFAEKKELNFYRGAKVDWWNFAMGEREMELRKGCGHVLKRKGFGDVLKKVRKPLDSSNTEDSLIVSVTLLHQPGAGGSTLARHVLWELRQDFRCIVVNKVTNNTAKQIMEVRRHGYEKGCNQKIPAVCVLVDDLDDVELLDLIDELKEGSSDIQLSGGAVCVLLHCKRCAEPEKLIDAEKKELYIALTQKLDAREKDWLKRKYLELQLKEKELQSTEYKPEHLLAFMVMMKEFDKDYIRHVVSEILGGISDNEFKLIKLCAFLNSYRPEAVIPVSCCDSLMASEIVSSRKRVHSRPWEGLVSSSFKIMVVLENNKLRIFHESIAKEALEQIKVKTNQSLAEVAREFLNCELFKSWSYSKQTLVKATHDLLVRRKKIRYGDDTETDYAVIIQDVLEKHGPQDAIEILKIGFEKLKDAFVAQQLARLCLKENSIEMAHVYAGEAVELEPQNCYFWDTKGRIYKTEMFDVVSKRMEEQQVVDDTECKKLLSLAYHAMDAFHKSYDVSKEGREIEYTGLYEEVHVAFRLLEVIYTCVEPFRTKRGHQYLQEYLLQLIRPSDPSYPKLSDYCHSRIMTLKNRVDSVLNLLEDTSTFCKEDPIVNMRQKLDEMKDYLKDYFGIYERYYGEPTPIPENRYRDPKSLVEFRRRQVKQANCGSFRDIFDLARNKGLQKLKESCKLLLENSDQYNFFDLKCLVCIHLALSSAGEQLLPADEVYQQFVRPLNAKDHRKTDCWPPFFMMMFLWPIPDVTSERRDRSELSYYIEELRHRFSGGENFSGRLAREKRPLRFQTKARTHFFLGQGTDLQVFAHINELHATPGKIDRADSDGEFWSSDLVRGRLARLEGTLLNPTSLVHLSKKGKINIKLAAPYKRQVPSQETVTFYLGFTWDGPVAYDIKIKGTNSREDAAPRFHQAYPSLNVPSEKSKTSLSHELSEIDKLREECQTLRDKLQKAQASPRNMKVKTKEGDVQKSKRDTIRWYQRQLDAKNDELRRALMKDTSSAEDF
ncbi:sterile alpha motif domain-containing protein 9-like [Acanthaster planci]|uniref:Sterile alpha motif domain-containing protein 9-like n=1 Tax=Acanthaster planci TaxID=133434 RepID=A0A8B7XLL3_ACAPL|nr:sterile alpha motif domain-containing protein 9-like [Acanthaster planci]